MLELDFIWRPATNHWAAKNAPPEISSQLAAWVVSEPRFNPDPVNYNLANVRPGQHGRCTYQTSSIHARSCYLGKDSQNNHFFAKGIGWVLADGWTPAFGSTGILPLWAAERERDIAIRLAKIGISVVEPVSILIHQSVPSYGTKHSEQIESETVLDLDGTKAFPSMYIYKSRCRWRLADLPFLSSAQRYQLFDELGGVERWLQGLITQLSESVGVIHKNKGHDHSLSTHNVFLNGERLDFEYAVVDEHPHRLNELNINPSGWREKELYSLKLMSYEVVELTHVKWTSSFLETLIRRRYEEISSEKFPF